MLGTQQSAPLSPADADAKNWVDRYAPAAAKPYLRLMRADRPIGTWLLLLPCWWGLGLAAAQGLGSLASLWHGVLFAVGAVVMRGAGCAYNDIVDRDIDAKVARTALRPLPSGQITLRRAWAFLAALCLVGLIVLLQFNPLTIYLGLGSLALVAIYPFMKRVTFWPQAWLGLTFNWGALMGYAAATGTLSVPAFCLYAAGFFWTLGYDTIYAHQDKEYDALIGVKSSALKLGAWTKPAIAAFYAATLALFALAGVMSDFSLAYYLALTPSAVHFFLQWRRLDIDDASRCLTIFKSNRDAGLLLLAPMLVEAALSFA